MSTLEQTGNALFLFASAQSRHQLAIMHSGGSERRIADVIARRNEFDESRAAVLPAAIAAVAAFDAAPADVQAELMKNIEYKYWLAMSRRIVARGK